MSEAVQGPAGRIHCLPAWISFFYHEGNQAFPPGPLQLERDPLAARGIGRHFDPRHFKQALGGLHGVCFRVFIGKVHNLPDAALDDRLGAFVAGEQRAVNAAAPQPGAGVIQNGVELGVADVSVFRFEHGAFALPGELVVRAAGGHPVVAYGEDFIFRAHDAGAHLGAAVFAALGGKQGNAHEVFVPPDIIGTFQGKTSFSRPFWGSFPNYIKTARKAQYDTGFVSIWIVRFTSIYDNLTSFFCMI